MSYLINNLQRRSQYEHIHQRPYKKGSLKPSGRINEDKINLVAGAITQPFAEMVWVTTGGDMDTINRPTDIVVTMNTSADRGKWFKLFQRLCGLMGLRFSDEAAMAWTQ